MKFSCPPVISALGELSQESPEFPASLDYISRPCLNDKLKGVLVLPVSLPASCENTRVHTPWYTKGEYSMMKLELRYNSEKTKDGLPPQPPEKSFWILRGKRKQLSGSSDSSPHRPPGSLQTKLSHGCTLSSANTWLDLNLTLAKCA